MARKKGETTADVRARKERRAVAPKYREGSVAANRAAGTNKAAVNQAAKASASASTPARSAAKFVAQTRSGSTNSSSSNSSGSAPRVKSVRKELAAAEAAGKPTAQIQKRLENAKTVRNTRRQAKFDRQDPATATAFNFADHSKKKVGAKELAYLVRDKGFSKDNVSDAAYGSGLVIGDRAQKRLDKWAAAKDKANGTITSPVKEPTPTPIPTRTPIPTPTPTPTQTITPSPTPTPTPTKPPINPPKDPYPTIVTPKPNPTSPTTNTPSPYTNDSFNDYDDSFNNQNYQDIDYTQELNINQDNDINNTINGDGNYVNAYQDNSIRNYGGDIRNFNYQSTGKGGSVDNPVSAATMAGYYSPSDSPAANAARLDRRVTAANDYGMDNFNTGHIAQGAMRMAKQNLTIDPAAMDARVQQRAKASKAKAYMMGNSIYGDLAGFRPTWMQPESPKKPEMPNFG